MSLRARAGRARTPTGGGAPGKVPGKAAKPAKVAAAKKGAAAPTPAGPPDVGRLDLRVGVVLSALGLDPLNIFSSIERLIRHIWNMGFDALKWLWQYFLLGAVLVIPIWLIMRIVRAPKGR